MVTGSAIVFVLLRRGRILRLQRQPEGGPYPTPMPCGSFPLSAGIAHHARTCAGSTRSGRTQSGSLAGLKFRRSGSPRYHLTIPGRLDILLRVPAVRKQHEEGMPILTS